MKIFRFLVHGLGIIFLGFWIIVTGVHVLEGSSPSTFATMLVYSISISVSAIFLVVFGVDYWIKNEPKAKKSTRRKKQ